jgi:5-methylcytosine-specific restriction endonuclease McrA
VSKVRYYNRTRRLAEFNGEKINPLCLFALYGWTCGYCQERIDPDLRYPDPMCATIDHIVPLSKGGNHTWSNCQPMHKACNENKGDQLPA